MLSMARTQLLINPVLQHLFPNLTGNQMYDIIARLRWAIHFAEYAVAISYLDDLAQTYHERFSVTFTNLEGNQVTNSIEIERPARLAQRLGRRVPMVGPLCVADVGIGACHICIGGISKYVFSMSAKPTRIVLLVLFLVAPLQKSVILTEVNVAPTLIPRSKGPYAAGGDERADALEGAQGQGSGQIIAA